MHTSLQSAARYQGGEEAAHYEDVRIMATMRARSPRR
jgi:hypothetical protein